MVRWFNVGFHEICGPFNWYGLTLILAWINNHMLSNVWDELLILFQTSTVARLKFNKHLGISTAELPSKFRNTFILSPDLTVSISQKVRFITFIIARGRFSMKMVHYRYMNPISNKKALKPSYLYNGNLILGKKFFTLKRAGIAHAKLSKKKQGPFQYNGSLCRYRCLHYGHETISSLSRESTYWKYDMFMLKHAPYIGLVNNLSIILKDRRITNCWNSFSNAWPY